MLICSGEQERNGIRTPTCSTMSLHGNFRAFTSFVVSCSFLPFILNKMCHFNWEWFVCLVFSCWFHFPCPQRTNIDAIVKRSFPFSNKTNVITILAIQGKNWRKCLRNHRIPALCLSENASVTNFSYNDCFASCLWVITARINVGEFIWFTDYVRRI